MNWPLARFLALWTAGVGAVVAAVYTPAAPPSPNAWVADSPLRTSGCPAIDVQLAAWQRSLHLADWSIGVDCEAVPRGRDILGATLADPKSRSARIVVRAGLSRGWQQLVLVHELLHVGAAAGTWPAPAGFDEEEEYVDAMAYLVYDDRVREVRQSMLERVRRAATSATSTTSWDVARAFDGAGRGTAAGTARN